MLRFFKHILEIIISPARGWEDVSHDSENPDDICREGLYPFYGLMSLTCFVKMIYDSDNATVTGCLEEAIVLFVVFFAMTFLAPIILYPAMTSSGITEKEPNKKRVATFSIYCMAIMALTQVIANLTPNSFAIIQLLPAYLLLVIGKANRYIGVTEPKEALFLALGAAIIIGAPLLLIYVLNYLMV